MNKLPKPKSRYGYPSSQLDNILRKLGVSREAFGEAFGVNTCSLDEKTGEVLYYKCDIERALYKLGHKLGRYHQWD